MGFAMSNYMLFNKLSDKTSDDFHNIVNSMSQFSLFGMILYDPEKDKEIYQTLSRNFSSLHRKTDDKFLFMAICNPPIGWEEAMKDWANDEEYDYYRKSFFDNNSSTSRAYSEEELLSLANALDLTPDKLPCILITNSLLSNQYYWIKTGPKHIESQLMRLGLLVEEIDYRGMSGKEFKKSLDSRRDQLDFYDAVGFSGLSDSIAALLHKVLAFHYSQDKDEKTRNIAQKSMHEAMRSFNLDVQAEREKCTSIGQLTSTKLDDLLIDIQFALAAVPTNNSYVFPHQNLENCMESLSYYRMKTGYKLFELFNDTKIDDFLYNDGGGGQKDYSPAMIGIFSAFENEVGLSLAQLIRKNEFSIKMPEYFCLYDKNKGKQKYLIDEDFEIDFNQKGKNDKSNRHEYPWKPPGLGQMCIVVGHLIKHKPEKIKEFLQMENDFKSFMINWRVLNQNRNFCAHPRGMTLSESIKSKETFEKIIADNIFQSLFKLKTALRTLSL